MKSMSKSVLGVIVLVVLGASAGMFFAGIHYQESKASASTPGQQFATRGGGNGSGGNGGAFRNGGQGGNGGGMANGQVIAKDDQSITVKMQDGSTRTIYYSGSTTFGKMAQDSVSDLQNGDQVTATGSSNPDGSIAAQNILIRPAGSPDIGFGFGGSRNGNGSNSGNGDGNGGQS